MVYADYEPPTWLEGQRGAVLVSGDKGLSFFFVGETFLTVNVDLRRRSYLVISSSVFTLIYLKTK